MSNSMQDMMAEATRLVQEGRLSDATAAIQSALGGGLSMGAGQAQSKYGRTQTTGEVIDVPLTPLKDLPGSRQGKKRGFRRGSDGGRVRPAAWKPDIAWPGTAPTGPTTVPDGGRFIERSYANAAGTRAYKLYVPSSYTGQEEVPLVVMLHGCTQDPNDFAAGTCMNALAEERTFLVAYPQQGGGNNMQKCWNWFKGGDQGRGKGEPSIIAGITCEVLGEYKVAPDRVYVAGMSAGGAMAAIMGSAYPDLYAAVGVHSGLAPGAAQDLPSALSAMQGGGGMGGLMGTPPPSATVIGAPDRVVPLIVFHGDRDGTVSPRNAEAVISHYRATGLDGKTTRPIKVRQGKVPDGYSYTRSTHQDADGRPVVEHWNVHGLGHAWSGGGRPGSYTDPKGPDASAEMARFFDEHRLES